LSLDAAPPFFSAAPPSQNAMQGRAAASIVSWTAVAGGEDMLHLTSPRYRENQPIPAEYTCDGRESSPPLQWYELPEETVSLALIIEDPDAPDPENPQRTWTHWVVYNLPASEQGLEEAAASRGLPLGARQGANDWGDADYGGPCPPIGRHRYVHHLYALDTQLPPLDEPSAADLRAAMSRSAGGHEGACAGRSHAGRHLREAALAPRPYSGLCAARIADTGPGRC
jgi:Raf kinase inhibitor-like YbhB/YbcL family protein